MSSMKFRPITHRLQKGFLACVLLGLVLVLLGWGLLPDLSWLSLAGVLLILLCYGLAGVFGFSRISASILNLAGFFGLAAGLVFASEICLEYALLPQDNTNWGTLEFGSVFVLYLCSGLLGAFRHRNLSSGILAAVVSAMLSSVIWLSVALFTFYLFRGSARQAAVFLAEGNYADFARSGMKDFGTFMIEDFFGAGFFHLLLAPGVATLLGTLGSWIGIGLAYFKKQD
jgi:hypothetical protein